MSFFSDVVKKIVLVYIWKKNALAVVNAKINCYKLVITILVVTPLQTFVCRC